MSIVLTATTAYAGGGGGIPALPNAPSGSPTTSASTDVTLNKLDAIGSAGFQTWPATDASAGSSHYVSSQDYTYPTSQTQACVHCCPTTSDGSSPAGPVDFFGLTIANGTADQYTATVDLPVGYQWAIGTGIQLQAWRRMMAVLQAALHGPTTNVQDYYYAVEGLVELKSGSILTAGGACAGVLVGGIAGVVKGSSHALPTPPWKTKATTSIPSLVTQLEASWNIGQVVTAPTTTAYVFVPVCASLQGSTLPFVEAHAWVYEATSVGGYVEILRYDLYAKVNDLVWHFSDGSTIDTPGPGTPGPATYLGSGVWSSCPGGGAEHDYKTVGSANVTATAQVSLWSTVTWDSGTGLQTEPVTVSGAPLAVPAGSATLSVDQIEAT